MHNEELQDVHALLAKYHSGEQVKKNEIAGGVDHTRERIDA
jgi:hypothetical protein